MYFDYVYHLSLQSRNFSNSILYPLLATGLHDNPWLCDCRLYDLVQIQKSPSPSVAFIDTSLRCTAPESLSGVLFSDADLRRCQEPKVHSAVSRIRSTVGNNVLLRCGAVGVPMPKLTWRRADGKTLNGTGMATK